MEAIKRKIITAVEQTDDEELLMSLYEHILEFAAAPTSIGQILGGVDFVELKAQVDDTEEEEMSFEQMMKNIRRKEQ